MYMTDDQLVLALINSYKSRGIDLSRMLDDPLFDKLPAASKIKAIQQYAGPLHEGVSGRFGKSDFGRMAVNATLGGATGALTGYGLGRSLAAHAAGGVTPLRGALTGAAILGLSGAVAGGIKALSSVDDRRAIKNGLSQAQQNPSLENAIGVLSTRHMTSSSRSLKEGLLDHIASMINNAGSSQVEPYLVGEHNSLLGLE